MKISIWILGGLLLAGCIAAVQAGDLLVNDTYYSGDQIIIEGKTNYNTDNTVLLEIYPLSFGPTKKWDQTMNGGSSMTVPVVKTGESDGQYGWTANVSTTGWSPQEYMVRAEVIGKEYQETASFLLSEKNGMKNSSVVPESGTEKV